MSGAGTTDDDDDEEQHERLALAVEEDCFHDSLDRILSSSNSSTSASEDDDVVFNSPPYHRRSPAVKRSPKFPISVPNYDAWISDAAFSSASLQLRRDRLLRALGVSSDRKPSLSDNINGFDISRSVSYDHLTAADTGTSKIHPDPPNSTIPRSKSEGECHASFPLCNLPLSVSTPSTIILSACSTSGNTVNSDTAGGRNTSVHIQDSVVGVDNMAVSSKHCSGGSNRSGSDVLKNGGVSHGEDAESNDARSQMCTIRNLDTGKEFVVNELREDGMCNKLKEVGTGRQLTMEEFELCVGHSPIVQELMRRQNVEEQANDKSDANATGENGTRPKKKVSWFKSIKNVATSVTGQKERRSSDERDTSSDKGGRRSSSATDDSQDVSFNGPERVRVRQYGKSIKELTAVYKSQEIQAHNGSIWSIKFSLDGKYLASAGEDCVIHVWQVVESERKGELLIDRPDDVSLSLLLLTTGSPEPNSLSPSLGSPLERKRRGRTSISRKSVSLDHIVIPDTVFGLSEKPVCSFQGHLDDVLDLSWSKSQDETSSVYRLIK